MRTKPNTIQLAAIGLFATGISIAPAVAAELGTGVPCAGVWMINEQATMRATGQQGPSLQFYEPWGPNGWMRMNTGAPEDATFAEWHFEQFNEQPYQVFGTDPSLGKARKITDRVVEASRVRLGEEANSQFVIFSQDCSRVTMYKAEGEDRHAPPGQTHYYNDLRVYDKIEPPAGSPAGLSAAAELFGGWELSRAASKLTFAPNDAETVVIVPWEKSGWVWNQISGGPYQPENLHNSVERVECGAASGAAAIDCQGPPRNMMLYWATWDSKPFPTYGTRRLQMQVRQVNDRNFEVTSFEIPQGAASGDKTTVALSPDGARLTVITKSGANRFEDDVRVYNRINGDTWPTVAP